MFPMRATVFDATAESNKKMTIASINSRSCDISTVLIDSYIQRVSGFESGFSFLYLQDANK